jgi:hypothetical protein
MARLGSYNPESDTFRAPLAASYTAPTVSGVPVGVVIAVSLNTSGRVVLGSTGGTAGLGRIGLIIPTRNMAAGEMIDVLTGGEVEEFGIGTDGQTAAVAGTAYYGVAATGLMSATAAGNDRVGFTVEATRLVIGVGR